MALKDHIPLNLGLMANPYNWIVVTLMVLIAGLGLSLVVSPPPSQQNGS